jgi:hypothetical protein
MVSYLTFKSDQIQTNQQTLAILGSHQGACPKICHSNTVFYQLICATAFAIVWPWDALEEDRLNYASKAMISSDAPNSRITEGEEMKTMERRM